MAGAGERHRTKGIGRKWLLWLLNGWIVFHLTAIVVAPASVSPSSDLIRSMWRACRPYLQLLYLNHGYHYFAPEPSESTLVGYTVELDDGSLVQGRILHRGIWPRLLYHRHFMLTEFLNFPSPELQKLWHRSYARHLCRKYGASRVSLTRITHYLPYREQVRAGATLHEPESYAEQPLGSFRCDEF